MTGFSVPEASRQDSQPVALFEFRLFGVSYGYTPSQTDRTVGGVDYISTRVKRDPIILGKQVRKRALRIRVPQSNIFANLYVGTPPGGTAEISIRRYQAADTTQELIELFTGRVMSVQFDEENATIACQGIEGVVSRNVLRIANMATCNHVLYGPGCNVDPTPHTLTNLEITAINGTTITVAGSDPGSFSARGGFVRPTGANVDQRVVLSQSGEDLRLMLPFRDLTVGSRVDVLRGCNHIVTEDCAVVFNNVIQNLSFHQSPKRNPWRRGLL